jgi:dUTP pyrophosphatase
MVIDEDYRGCIIVALHNDSDVPQLIEEGERIAQLIAIPYLTMEFKSVDTLSPSIRGDGGFGSTGTN